MFRSLIIGLLLLAACGAERTDYGTGSDGGSGPPATSPTGLPCDVAQVLQASCTSCHSDPPLPPAPMPLVTYAQLTAPSARYPGQSYAQRSLARMQDASLPMPPGGGASAAAVATLQAWVSAGTPAGSCATSTPDGGTPGLPNSPPTCTSGTYWSRGNEGSALMHPGGACIACHSSGEGPWYSAAGTVYPTTHEPDDCNGASGITVTITDAAGNVSSQTANSAGNFYFRTNFQFPIHAKVEANGATRQMLTPQMSGDCDLCHTQNGTANAPGRVVAP